jgi:hypothetical protein
VAVSFKYGAEALALLGVAYGLIKWVGRSLRSQISDVPLEETRLQALSAATGGERVRAPGPGADMLVRQGIVSAAQLAGMTPRERAFLVATAAPQMNATRRPGAPGQQSPPASANPPSPTGAGRPRSPTPVSAGRPTPPSPRLHLITPSRPPLGVAVHCPACGAVLDRDALQRFGETKCERCRRPVSAHIQRGRLTVIIEETPEEAEHRRRIDGGG